MGSFFDENSKPLAIYILISFLACVSNLQGETSKTKSLAPVDILSVNTDTYPRISLRVRLRKPHLEFPNNDNYPMFKLYEIYEEVETRIENIHIYPIKKEAAHLNLVWIIDTSLSLNPELFRKTKSFSQLMIQSLGDQDQAAIYSAKEKPSLLNDFTSNQQDLLRAIQDIRHDGKVTRLYDAVYSGLYTAQSIIQSSAKQDNHTVVVLLTDGKEKASYLNDEDCYELSAIGHRLNIPIFVVIFGEKTAASNPHSGNSQKTLHHRLLKRLTLKTEGAFIVNPKVKPSANFLQTFRLLKEKIYNIHYHSPNAVYGFPNSKIILRVALRKGDYSDVSYFRIPWMILFKNQRGWVILGLVLIFLLSLVFSLFALFSVRRKASNEQRMFPEPGQFLEDTASKEASQSNKQQVENAIPTIKKKPRENLSFPLVETQLDYPDHLDVLPDHPGVLIEDERMLYLREYSYRMLQLALRHAKPYQKASLSTTIAYKPPRLPKKRTYDLFLKNTILGSGRWAHIPLRDPVASPSHAKVQKIEKYFVLYDLLSGSGVYLNNHKVLRPMALKNGDEIRIGRMRFHFSGVSHASKQV